MEKAKWTCWVDEEKKAEGAVVGASFKDYLLIERGGAAREQGGKDPETHAKVLADALQGMIDGDGVRSGADIAADRPLPAAFPHITENANEV